MKKSRFKNILLTILVALILMTVQAVSTAFIYNTLGGTGTSLVLELSGKQYHLQSKAELEDLLSSSMSIEIPVAVVGDNQEVIQKKSLKFSEVGSYLTEQELASIESSFFSGGSKDFFVKLKNMDPTPVTQVFRQVNQPEEASKEQVIRIQPEDVQVDQEKVKNWVFDNITPLTQDYKKSALIVQNGTIVPVEAHPGIYIDTSQAVKDIELAMAQPEKPITINAVVKEGNKGAIESLKQYNVLVGEASQTINLQNEEAKRILRILMNSFTNTGIGTSSGFSFSAVSEKALEGESNQSPEYDKARQEAESVLVNLMYQLAQTSGMKVVRYWDSNISMGSPTQYPYEENEKHLGLIFENNTPYQLIISTWQEGSEIHMAFFGLQ